LQKKEGILINIIRRVERYNIKSRAAAVGLTLTELLRACNARTGRRMGMPDFTKARKGIDRSPGAEQTLEVADGILQELELEHNIK